MRSGLAQHLFRDRLSIDAADGEDPDEFVAERFLTDHLRDIFGLPELSIAVRVGRARPNRKPLIQALSPDGEVVGYVKVGWNDLTRGLVRNETRVLADLAARTPPRTFEVPRIVHSGAWRDLELLALSPLHGRLLRRIRPYVAPVVAAVSEVSRLSQGSETQLARSDYWSTTRGRIAAVGADDEVLRLADRLEERHGEDVLAFGSWHGDWAPWNLAWRDGRVAVWDWERSTKDAPAGLDAAHFDFQVALRDARRHSGPALRRVLTGATPLLSALALPPNRVALLLSLHLLEMSLRYQEARQAGVTTTDSIYLPALAALLGDRSVSS